MTTIEFPTADGVFLAVFSESGLARLSFPQPPGTPRATEAESHASAGGTVPPAWIQATRSALTQLLAGGPAGEIPPLDLRAGTEFQRSVWEALRAIPPGRTRSYGELAAQVGRPGGARAVGQACGANPIPLLIPCHRVLAAQGRLGGFSGGLAWKRRLLEREGTGFLC